MTSIEPKGEQARVAEEVPPLDRTPLDWAIIGLHAADERLKRAKAEVRAAGQERYDAETAVLVTAHAEGANR